jgi:exosortase E/protease (VPEID-CTERM system)
VATTTGSRRTLPAVLRGMTLGARLVTAAAVLVLEKTILNLFVDFDRAQEAQGFGQVVRVAQHAGFRFLLSLAVAIVLFGYLSRGRELAAADEAGRGIRMRGRWLALHVLLVVPLAPLSIALYGERAYVPFPAVVALWLLLATLAVAALLMALAPWSLWRGAAQSLGVLWGYSLVAAAGSVAAMGTSQLFWVGTARVTFEAVYRLVGWFIPALRVDPSGLVIDTGRFAVAIDPVCSGLEGMGLMLAFCSALLLLFRHEFIFPRAFILVPLGLLVSFALNVVRIAVLVLIGSAGYASVAVYGFHSQAGWIAFNAAAAALAFVSLRSGWLTRTAADKPQGAVENPTAVYLLPFLALLAAGMLSRAISGGVETFYWLRLVGVGLAMIYSWPRLRGLAWGCSWRGPAAGIAAYVLWTAAAHVLGGSAAEPSAPPGMAPLPHALWVGAHFIVSVGAVPIAEELAFRGFLLRRIVSSDFESVPPRSIGVWTLLLSSLLFGLCHGTLWLPGTATGVIFGLVYMRTQRLGEAFAAHAIANALIALDVLGGFPLGTG